MQIDDLVNKMSRKDGLCDLCNLFSTLESSQAANKTSEFKIIKEKKNRKIDCHGCSQEMKAIVSKAPHSLGHDKFLKIKDTVSVEDPEREFCKIAFAYLYEKINNKYNVYGIPLFVKSKSYGDYDILLLVEKDGNDRSLIQVEFKFKPRDNIDSDDYRKFLERHIYMENMSDFLENKYCIKSIFFNPYNVGNFNEKISSLVEKMSNPQKDIIMKSMKDGRIDTCFYGIKDKSQIESFLTSPEKNISSHLKALVNKIIKS